MNKINKKMNKKRLNDMIKSAICYVDKYRNYYEICRLEYNKTGDVRSLRFMEWYIYVETFIKSNISVYDNFNKLFKTTSENCGYLINNAEFPEDQILLPYQILAKSIFN